MCIRDSSMQRGPLIIGFDHEIELIGDRHYLGKIPVPAEAVKETSRSAVCNLAEENVGNEEELVDVKRSQALIRGQVLRVDSPRKRPVLAPLNVDLGRAAIQPERVQQRAMPISPYFGRRAGVGIIAHIHHCLLYTSDAA